MYLLTSRCAPRAAPAAVLVGTVLAGTALLTGCGSTSTGPPAAAPSGASTPAPGHESQTPTATRQASRPSRAALPAGRLGTYRVRRYARRLGYRPAGQPARRVLRVFVSYPAVPRAAGDPRRGLFPLVVFAPGYRQCAAVYRVLLREWASAGYVVAAVQFPRTNCHVAAPDEADLVNQPADMSEVIGRLVAAGRRPGDRLSGLVDGARVAVAGHSDGGDTVAAMVASTCCRDRRVSAAVVLAGAEWAAMPGRYFAAPTVPMLFVQGTADTWNPQSASLQLYQADTRGRRYYLALPGVGHFTPYEGGGPPEPVVARVTVDFLDRYLAGQAGALGAMRRAGRAAGRDRLVSGGRLPYLGGTEP
jgi:dienelactone hydrolase